MSLLPPRGLDASMPATLPFPMAQDSDVIRFSEVRAEVEGVPIAIQIRETRLLTVSRIGSNLPCVVGH